MNITVYLDILFLKLFILESVFLFGGGYWLGSNRLKDRKFYCRILITALIQSLIIIGLYSILLSTSQVLLVILEVIVIFAGFWFCYRLRGRNCFWAMILALVQTMICLGNTFTKIQGILITAGLLFGFRKKDKQEMIYEIKFLYGGNVITCKAILDTGNALREPYRNRAVCVAERNVFGELLDEENDMEGMIYIPFHSVGHRNGLMKALVMHNVKISSKQNAIVLPEMVVGIMEEQLDAKRKYQMLLHKEFIKYF